ncbi:MAG: DUF6297 family protein [Marmoricola sp.]
MNGAGEVRELRGDIRHWRRGHANKKLSDAISDAYIALFATVMFGSMAVNVVLNVRRVGGRLCTTQGCQEARALLPWLAGVAAVLMVLSVARLFGPVFASPAVGTWLLPTPVDRAAVLRPRLLWTVLISVGLAALVAAAAASLGGFAGSALLAFVGSTAVLTVVVVALAAVSQSRGGLLGRLLALLLGVVLWAGLLALALTAVPLTGAPGVPTAWLAGIVVAALLAVALLVRSLRDIGRLRRVQVARGGALTPGLSGALATLDLALVYDVLLAHRWAGRGAVRPRRGGPGGPAALVTYDLVRLLRSPQVPLVLLASVVVPYTARTAGAGRVVVLIAALTGFVAGLRLLTAMRVVSRTPSLLRAMPFPVASARMATLAVPAGCFLVFGLATVPALQAAEGRPWADVVPLGVTVAASALASATRWVTGRPPDYTRPLVSTPAGGVPTNLYGSVIRGVDVLLLTTAPLLLLPTATGTAISLVLSFVVLSYLVGRE